MDEPGFIVFTIQVSNRRSINSPRLDSPREALVTRSKNEEALVTRSKNEEAPVTRPKKCPLSSYCILS
jgi:hypothetical protein